MPGHTIRFSQGTSCLFQHIAHKSCSSCSQRLTGLYSLETLSTIHLYRSEGIMTYLALVWPLPIVSEPREERSATFRNRANDREPPSVDLRMAPVFRTVYGRGGRSRDGAPEIHLERRCIAVRSTVAMCCLGCLDCSPRSGQRCLFLSYICVESARPAYARILRRSGSA